MAHYCWARRESFGSQTESLQDVRETYPNGALRPLATVCYSGWYTVCDSGVVAYSGVQAHDKDPTRPGDPLRTQGPTGVSAQVSYDRWSHGNFCQILKGLPTRPI